MASLPVPKITAAEYLERDRANIFKSEYLDGQMYAMAGASNRHNVINENISGALFAALRSKGCQLSSSDLRVHASIPPFFAYPDKIVTCGERTFLDGEKKDTLTNPRIIFEVLSESTRAYDLGLKFAMYTTIASLREYVAVEQDRQFVHHWTRNETGEWARQEEAPVLYLRSVNVEAAVADFYLDLK